MNPLKNRLSVLIKELKNNRFISFINTDSNELVISNLMALQDFHFYYTTLESLSNLDHITLEIKHSCYDAILISAFIFDDQADKTLRVIYDSTDVKIIVLPKYRFDYDCFGTQISGRAEIVNFYCFKYPQDEHSTSFKDYVLTTDFSTPSTSNDIDSLFKRKKTALKLKQLLNIFATSLGKPLSIREIMRKMETLECFLHPRMAQAFVKELVNNRILLPCTRFDEIKKINVSTNILYFFNSNYVLTKFQPIISQPDLLLNAFFLELYYKSSSLSYLKEQNQNTFTFLRSFEQGQQIISFTYRIDKVLQNLADSLRRKKLNAQRYIVSYSKIDIKEAYGIRIIYIDEFLKME